MKPSRVSERGSGVHGARVHRGADGCSRSYVAQASLLLILVHRSEAAVPICPLHDHRLTRLPLPAPTDRPSFSRQDGVDRSEPLHFGNSRGDHSAVSTVYGVA